MTYINNINIWRKIFKLEFIHSKFEDIVTICINNLFLFLYCTNIKRYARLSINNIDNWEKTKNALPISVLHSWMMSKNCIKFGFI